MQQEGYGKHGNLVILRYLVHVTICDPFSSDVVDINFKEYEMRESKFRS